MRPGPAIAIALAVLVALVAAIPIAWTVSMSRRVAALEEAIERERGAYLADRWRLPGELGCNSTEELARIGRYSVLSHGIDDARRAWIRARTERALACRSSWPDGAPERSRGLLVGAAILAGAIALHAELADPARCGEAALDLVRLADRASVGGVGDASAYDGALAQIEPCREIATEGARARLDRGLRAIAADRPPLEGAVGLIAIRVATESTDLLRARAAPLAIVAGPRVVGVVGSIDRTARLALEAIGRTRRAEGHEEQLSPLVRELQRASLYVIALEIQAQRAVTRAIRAAAYPDRVD